MATRKTVKPQVPRDQVVVRAIRLELVTIS